MNTRNFSLEWLLPIGMLWGMEFVLQACLALTHRLLPWALPRRYAHAPPSGRAGVALFFFLIVGVPILAVLWGYATGRLPAPSPYTD